MCMFGVGKTAISNLVSCCSVVPNGAQERFGGGELRGKSMAECNFLPSWQRRGIKWRSLPGWLEGIASRGDKWLAVISDRIWFLQAGGKSADRPASQPPGRLTALSQVTPWEDTRACSQEIKSPAVVNHLLSSSFFVPLWGPHQDKA